VSEGKNDPIYNAHSYHTKVPHKAIMRYILHYTEPGDVIFDGFCGSGMTGVAAQMCGDKAVVESLGYRVEKDGTISQQETDENGKAIWKPFSKLGSRRAVLNDLSPAATFIAYNYNNPMDVPAFEREAKRILKEVEAECGWMYETLHTDGRTKGKINFTVWSQVYACPECVRSIRFVDEAIDNESQKVQKTFTCPHCNTLLSKKQLQLLNETVFDPIIKSNISPLKREPVLIDYSLSRASYQKTLDAFDLSILAKISTQSFADEVRSLAFPFDDMWEAPRLVSKGITHTHHLFVNRTLHVMSSLWHKVSAVQDAAVRNALKALVHHQMVNASIRNTYRPASSFGNRALTSAYYVSAMAAEANFLSLVRGSLKRIARAGASLSQSVCHSQSMISTQSSLDIAGQVDGQADYVFIDPPFGDNFPYAELNLATEAWHRVVTASTTEAIVDRSKVNGSKQKGLNEYRHLMTACFREAYRILKPGRWMTVEFSNTKASVWNSIQTALTEAGFIVANVSALDKKQGSFKAVTTPTAVKQDLVISAYKPNGGFEDRFQKEATSEEGVWDFVRTHLKYLPVVKRGASAIHLIAVAERDPRILYDQMVAYFIRKGYPVPLNSAAFQEGLSQRFSYRDGMYFLPDQVAEYDKRKLTAGGMEQMSLFVSDESSAIAWLRQLLKDKPLSFQDIHPLFIKELGGWQKYEKPLELSELLEQSFLRYDGKGEVPNQIHSYLSTNFKELRNLPKDDESLRAKGKDRWYVPDPNKAGDLEKLRERSLLKEFEDYRTSSQKRLKVFRLEAVRAGFKKAWQERDYATIITVARKVPENVLQEDPKLLMWYDQALTRSGEDA
jgi:16S rRNA G966 N2-methylase RsmD